MKRLVLLMAVAATMACVETIAATAAAADTIADQRAALGAATARLDRAAARGRLFETRRRVHVDLGESVFATWIAAIAPNGLSASATGTAAEGVLAERSRPLLGTVTAAIDPASATRLDLTLARPRISAAAGRLTITGDLGAEARARVRVSGRGPDQAVACRTLRPVTAPGTATLTLDRLAGSRADYTLRLTRPDDLRARLDCDIVDLRQIEPELPINSIAGVLGRGSIDIGLATDLRLPTPGAGPPMTVRLAPRRPDLVINSHGLAYSAD